MQPRCSVTSLFLAKVYCLLSLLYAALSLWKASAASGRLHLSGWIAIAMILKLRLIWSKLAPGVSCEGTHVSFMCKSRIRRCRYATSNDRAGVPESYAWLLLLAASARARIAHLHHMLHKTKGQQRHANNTQVSIPML